MGYSMYRRPLRDDCTTVRYLDNLKQLVVSVFAHIQRKVLEKFDDALRVAGALDVAGTI